MADADSLSYSVRLSVVSGYLGQLLLLAGGFSVLPPLFALIESEWLSAATYAGASVVFLVVVWLLRRSGTRGEMQSNEAIVMVAMIFILVPAILAPPIMVAGVRFLDALFEAISGITTTGLSSLASVADMPRSLLFTRAWLQWLGGVAIMVLSFVLLFGQSANAKRLTGVISGHTDLLGGTRAYAAIVIRVYLGLTLIGVIALLLAGADWFPAVALTLSSVSTGGFSPFDDSLASVSGAVQAVVIVLCVCGAIAAPLYHHAATGEWRVVFEDPELRALFGASLVVGALLLMASLFGYGANAGNGDVLMTALSAQTTAGFTTMPVGQLDPFSKVVLILSMTIGGAVGSSAGGIKLLRLLVFIRLVQLMILRTRLPPHAAIAPSIAARSWSDTELTRLLVFIGLFFGVELVSWLPFLWLGYDPLDSLFEVVSATGTVGLSTGIAGPDLDPILKLVLCMDMLLGRLEVFPMLVLIAPRTWLGLRRKKIPASEL
jgi:trk system potassium uptake protein TrkH